jgi:hypothetical protein
LVVVQVGKQVAVIKGDPGESEEAFDKLVDALRAAFYESMYDGVVYVGFVFEDGRVTYFSLSQPFEYNGDEYAVLMDEDRRPLYVFDFTAVTWREAAHGLVRGLTERVREVVVEVGERW